MEAGQELEAGGDEGSTHENGSGDSPEEDFGLVARLDLEELEEEKEEKEVVDGQRLFDSVASEIFDRRLAVECEEDEDAEGKRGGDPEDRGGYGSGTDL